MASDAELFRRSVDEPRQFGEIFERHAPSVLRYVARRLGQDAAEDVAAETFLIAFERRADFDPTYESARPWLLGIATNLVRRRLRDERTRLAAIAKVVDAPAFDEFEAVSRLDAQRMGPLLIRALLSLSEDDRETCLLVAVGELSYAQTAEALQIPIGTVRSRMNRVRALLREQVPELPAIDDGEVDT